MPNLASFLTVPLDAKKQIAFIIAAQPAAEETITDNVRPDEEISISNYELSSIVTCSRVCYALEELWNVL